MDSKPEPAAVIPDPAQRRPRPGGGFVGIAIRQPVFTTMIMIGLMVLGAFSLRRLAIDEYPDVSIPILTVQTLYPGASPEVVERQVTKPIEEAVNTTQGIKKLTSQSYESISIILIEFELGTDISAATAEVRSKIEQTRRLMPGDIDTPVVQQVDISQQPIVSLALISTNQTVGQLSTLADNQVRRELEGVSGIGRVQISGGLKREIHVLLKPTRMYAMGVSANQVISALRSQNLDVPAGHIEHGNQEYLVRVVGNIRKPQDFANIVVANTGPGGLVRLSQIAEVLDTTEEQRAIALIDGRPGVGIDLLKVGGANTVSVAQQVEEVVEVVRKKLPAGVKLSIIRDNSVNIRDSVSAVRDELVMGAILTVAIVFLFLNDLRATLITSLAIPVSVISTFVVLQALGFTLNTMTLLALSLSIGLLIDDAIVVIESAVRHREGGKDSFQAALDGTHEIFLAVLASTLTIVAVFVPVAFMGGIIGKFFFQFGLTIAWAIMVSLFVSFTLTPMLSAWWGNSEAHVGGPAREKGWLGRMLIKFNALFDRLARSYRRVISWALDHPIKMVLTSLLSFVGAMALFPYIGGGFMPKVDTSDFNVDFNTPGGSSFQYTSGKAREIAQVLRGLGEVRQTYVTVGSGASSEINKGHAYVKLSPPKERQKDQVELMELARRRLSQIYGVVTSVSAAGGLGASAKPIQISIAGPQLQVLDSLAAQVVNAVTNVRGAIEVESSLGDPKPQVELKVDVEKANDLQLDAATIVNSVQPLLGGQVATRWNDADGNQTDVLVRLPLTDRSSAAEIGRLPIQRYGMGENSAIPLGQVAEIRQGTGVSLIQHEGLARVATIQANIQGRALSDVSKGVEAALKKIPLPPGYTINMGGDTKQLTETVGYVVQAILLAVILIYLILASQFGSFLQPLAIMFSVPLAIIGVLLALLVTHDTLNVMSMIGVIMLMGIVTKNAILLIDSANERRREGQNLHDALVHAGEVRLRPIIMTTLATIVGMLPIAFGLGAGGEGRAPMARAVIGGLITSTFLTLLVVPVVYIYLEEFGEWFQVKILRMHPHAINALAAGTSKPGNH